jgi:hypothetical protein
MIPPFVGTGWGEKLIDCRHYHIRSELLPKSVVKRVAPRILALSFIV